MHNANTGVTIEFKYNHEGIRTQKIKKVNGTVTETTDYTLKGKLIAAMKKNTTIVMEALRYAYGEEKFSNNIAKKIVEYRANKKNRNYARIGRNNKNSHPNEI